MLHTLLLNSSYEYVNFITERELIKHIVNNKVEVLANWQENNIVWGSGKMAHPAIAKLIKPIRRWQNSDPKFSRSKVFRRDHFLCCFCRTALTSSEITIDHLIPKSLGGKDTWLNCVSSCKPCNNKKSNKSLEECGMTLKIKPYIPNNKQLHAYYSISNPHPEWASYLGL